MVQKERRRFLSLLYHKRKETGSQNHMDLVIMFLNKEKQEWLFSHYLEILGNNKLSLLNQQEILSQH